MASYLTNATQLATHSRPHQVASKSAESWSRNETWARFRRIQLNRTVAHTVQPWTSNTIQIECHLRKLLRIVKSKPLITGYRIGLRIIIQYRYRNMRKIWDSRRLKIVRESPKNSNYMRPNFWKSSERRGVKSRREPPNSKMISIGFKSTRLRESTGLRMVSMRSKSTDQCQRCNHMLASARRDLGQTTARSSRRVSQQRAVQVIGKSAPSPMSSRLRKRKKGRQ